MSDHAWVKSTYGNMVNLDHVAAITLSLQREGRAGYSMVLAVVPVIDLTELSAVAFPSADNDGTYHVDVTQVDFVEYVLFQSPDDPPCIAVYETLTREIAQHWSVLDIAKMLPDAATD